MSDSTALVKKDKRPATAPILLLAFNRPDKTQRVFNAIRERQPTRLCVAVDGPRANNTSESEKVSEVLEIVSKVDWECDVTYLRRENNLGCKQAVSQAINWFFDLVECGMILEDDCLPSNSFFSFCTYCLHRYRSDHRIWDIAGSNLIDNQALQSHHSYFYSRYGGIWGWATWRDRWLGYDVELSQARQSDSLELLCSSMESWENPQMRMSQFKSIHSGFDTWDYQWLYHRLSQSGLSVIPQKNLVTNIGFGPDATHTFKPEKRHSNIAKDLSFPLQSPPSIIRDLTQDKKIAATYFPVKFKKRLRHSLAKLMTKR